MVILGIDPGLSATGYGFIEAQGRRLRVLEAGDIRPVRTQPLAKRLESIYQGLTGLIGRHRPDAAVLEKIFTHHHHVTTAAMMGHARGVACLAVQEHGVPLEEHLPTHVKKSLTGSGSASKEQVARMVGQWLGASDPSWSRDATDALALAIVHAHTHHHRTNLAGVLG